MTEIKREINIWRRTALHVGVGSNEESHVRELLDKKVIAVSEKRKKKG